MKLEQKIEKIVNLSQAIRSQEPKASNVREQQAAVTMAEVAKCIFDLFFYAPIFAHTENDAALRFLI
jgi:hypothetical protein